MLFFGKRKERNAFFKQGRGRQVDKNCGRLDLASKSGSISYCLFDYWYEHTVLW